MTGKKVFEQIVTMSEGWGKVSDPIDKEDYEQWQKDFIWEALHGQRYGQSFCNRFGIKDHHLFYAPGDVNWCDRYIRKHYVA